MLHLVKGSRVSRLAYMDDGTWVRHGDSCLAYSPRKFGTVIKVELENPWVLFAWPPSRKEHQCRVYTVKWDGKTPDQGTYYRHGLTSEE